MEHSNKQATLKATENGYIVIIEEPQDKMKDAWSKAMMKLLENTGAVEPWQEDKLKEIEETLKNMPQPHIPPSSKTYIFKTFKEAINFLYDYFQEFAV